MVNKVSASISDNLMIWVKARAREEGSSVAHQVRWALYEMKRRDDIRSIKP